MPNKYDLAREAERLALEKIKEYDKVTVHELARAMGWTVGKAQGVLNRLVKKGEVFRVDFPDFENKVFRVYYSIEPISLPTIPSSTEIPRYYLFLDDLFGEMLKDKEARGQILKTIKKMGMKIGDVIEMQKEAKGNE